ncbi:hypothetical protein FRB94_009183 [Tulasnella sp. JGI-2019a]|nr:hypothetical protein FRB94_009183 [Tulasnella sp. JGI-2019a]KAG9008225.1 hypothetical protein FRB93_006793 [Tulasnella sp. JGI-2019a]
MSTSRKLTVAIAGATGDVGTDVTKAFLKLHPETFSRILILTQNPNGEKAKALESLGAELVRVEGALQPGVLKGVDVLVNTQGSVVPPETSDSLFKEAVASGVKVYFPSEYGIDHRLGVQDHIWFHEKVRHVSAARSAAPGQLKVIQLYIGIFSSTIFSPYFGLDTANGVYSTLGSGSSEKKVAITATADIGAAVTRLSTLAVADPTSVPDLVRISSDNRSFKELAEIVGRETGKKINVVEEPIPESLGRARENLIELVEMLRLNFGTGSVDFSANSDNELVNPDQKFWKWQTVQDYARDVLAKE